MSKGLWSAVSGSIAQSQRLDTIANNLANADTAGFKRDQVAFAQVMSDATSAALKEEVPRNPPTDKDLHRLDGRDIAFVILDGTTTDHSQGRVKVTNGPLDVLIEGKGFIEIGTPQGVRYTRQGSFKLAADGLLVNTDGNPVLRKGGGDAEGDATARGIRLDPNAPGQISISKDGKIFQGADQVADIGVVEFVDLGLVKKEGNALYKNDVAANISPDAVKSTLHQGMLETSNVNPIQEMTELLKATRLFELNQKVVKNYGELESRSVNDLGKF